MSVVGVEAAPGAAVVAEARSWLGTPWHHQAPLKGVGCDCTGFVRGVIATFRELPAELQQMQYARKPDGVTMLALCRKHLLRVSRSAIAAGDVLVFAFERDPHHMAFAADYVHGGLSMIHALDQRSIKPGQVVEHRIDEVWRRRIVGAFRIPLMPGQP